MIETKLIIICRAFYLVEVEKNRKRFGISFANKIKMKIIHNKFHKFSLSYRFDGSNHHNDCYKQYHFSYIVIRHNPIMANKSSKTQNLISITLLLILLRSSALYRYQAYYTEQNQNLHNLFNSIACSLVLFVKHTKRTSNFCHHRFWFVISYKIS